MIIGFSIGDVGDLGLDLEEVLRLFLDSGANAVSIHFKHEDLIKFDPSEKVVELINNFEFVSFHDSFKGLGDNEDTKRIFDKYKKLGRKFKIDSVVTHYDLVEDFDYLDNCGLPMLIENGDKNKSVGTTLEEFIELKKGHGFGFVLDLQHIYEHDNSMNLAKDFYDSLGDKIKLFHVSGEKGDLNHSPVYLSDNIKVISQFVGFLNRPVILEGVFHKAKVEDLKKEIDFVKNGNNNRN